MMFAVIFLVSLALSIVLVLTRDHYMDRINTQVHVSATQSAHNRPTPRLGGVAILIALYLALLHVSAGLADPATLFALALVPVALAGLAEDLGFRMPPRVRLVAIACGAGLVIFLLGTWVDRFGFSSVDFIIAASGVGIPVTIVAVAGVTNAFNLLDGLNGLSSGTAIVTALGLCAVGHAAGLHDLVRIEMLFIAAVLGFLVVNYPRGQLFLGDAGAYTIGFVLSWFGVFTIAGSAEVAPFAMLLIFFWPIADTLFSIWRRVRARRAAMAPDRLHFHQLVMRALEICVLGRGRRHLANPLATLCLMPLISAPVVAGVLLWDHPSMAAFTLLIFGFNFVGIYLVGISMVRRLAGRWIRREVRPVERMPAAVGSN